MKLGSNDKKPSATTNPPATTGGGKAITNNKTVSDSKQNAKQGFKQVSPNQKNGDFSA